MGDVDFKRAMKQLREGGFDGFLTAEVFKTDENMSYPDYFKSIADAEEIILGYYNEV